MLDHLSHMSNAFSSDTTISAGSALSSLPIPQLIEVNGGQELTIISTAESAVTDNVRLEVRGSTKLVLDVPDLTITGIVDSVSRQLANPCGALRGWRGKLNGDALLFSLRFACQRVFGAVFIEEGSSMDVLHKVTFRGNSLEIFDDFWVSGVSRLFWMRTTCSKCAPMHLCAAL